MSDSELQLCKKCKKYPTVHIFPDDKVGIYCKYCDGFMEVFDDLVLASDAWNADQVT